MHSILLILFVMKFTCSTLCTSVIATSAVSIGREAGSSGDEFILVPKKLGGGTVFTKTVIII